jgi:hypothetical protein
MTETENPKKKRSLILAGGGPQSCLSGGSIAGLAR